MINIFKKVTNKPFDFKLSIKLMVGLLGFVICLFFFMLSKYSYDNSNQHSVERIQKELLDDENTLNSFFKRIESDTSAVKFSQEKLQKFKEESGIELFLFDHEKIKFWTSNLISVEMFLDDIYRSKIVKLNNGWFQSDYLNIGNYSLIGLIPIKSEYHYNNDLLPKSFNEDYQISGHYQIELEEGEYNIYNDDNEFLFSIKRIDDVKLSRTKAYILFILYHLVIIILLGCIKKLYEYLSDRYNNKLLLSCLFIADIIILGMLLHFLKFPALLYDSFIYSSDLYTGYFHNSLGSYFTNSIFFLFIVSVLKNDTFLNKRSTKLLKKSFLVLMLVVLIVSLLYFEEAIISLFHNTQFSIRFGEEFIQSPGISILIFTILSILSLSMFYLVQMTVNQFVRLCFNRFEQWSAGLVIILASAIICYFYSSYFFYTFGFFMAIVILVKHIKTDRYSAIQMILFLLIFSIYLSFVSTFVLQKKELTERKELASQLAGLPDPMAEYDFMEIEKAIYKDTAIREILRENTAAESEEALSSIIKDYFSVPSWKNYSAYVTICDTSRLLLIQPENYIINGNAYFMDFMDEDGKTIKEKSLIHLQNINLNNSYLARFSFDLNHDNNIDINIFVELVSEFIPEGIGYTELFADESQEVQGKDIINYSFIRYKNDHFAYKFGSFQYSLSFNQFSDLYKKSNNFTFNGYNHLVYNVDDNTKLVISRPQNKFWERIAPFSYFFILLLLFLVSYFLIANFSIEIFRTPIRFKQRIQFSLTSVIFFSFLVIGTITILHILDLNTKKNREILSEKAHSVLIELEHKLSNEENSIDDKDYLNQILNKFSLVFFSDINLFDLEGHVIASSRNRIFDEGLISPLMNSTAYHELTESQDLLFIQDECIGNYKYLSAYIPFRDKSNQVIAYLNLPYFARQSEIQKEISNFLVALVNIYLLFFVIGIIITILVSRNISKPLELIKNRMGQLKLGKLNEKIEWNKADEIGSLVSEYNRMVDELSYSANLLAKSERESAWREMAKQVAHEIKNPLTPMKLSVQFLQKSWKDDLPNWEERLEKFSTTIIDQINSLSEIASAFSDFAKMPKQKFESIELNNKIVMVLNLFKERNNIEIKFEPEMEPCYIKADNNQLLRLFNNLIKNSIQAIDRKSNGEIKIRLKKQNNHILISISDNGEGIPKERSDKIFTPSFTTKSSGMGLGLSIVKSIVLESEGKIWFDSEENMGTTFYIEFPDSGLENIKK